MRISPLCHTRKMFLSLLYVLLWTENASSASILSKKPLAVVAGRAGGVAECIAYHLLKADCLAGAVLNTAPQSPLLSSCIPKECLFRSVPSMINQIGKGTKGSGPSDRVGNVLILCPDPADDSISLQLADGELNVWSVVVEVVCNGDVPTRKEKGSLFSAELRAMCVRKEVPLVQIATGNLIGGIPGLEPLPFLGLPALEPELHPAYVLRSVSCTPFKPGDRRNTDPRIKGESSCTHEAISSLVVQLICMHAEGMFPSSGQWEPRTLQLSSIRGPPPTPAEWTSILSKALTPDALQRVLLSVPFQEVLRPQALMSWLSDTWYPQAVIDINAAVTTSGARPVKISRAGESSLVIVWEELRSDLKVVRVGELRIDVTLGGEGKSPCLTVMRDAAAGVLPGNALLAENLQNALKNNVYRKQLCTELEVARA